MRNLHCEGSPRGSLTAPSPPLARAPRRPGPGKAVRLAGGARQSPAQPGRSGGAEFQGHKRPGGAQQPLSSGWGNCGGPWLASAPRTSPAAPGGGAPGSAARRRPGPEQGEGPGEEKGCVGAACRASRARRGQPRGTLGPETKPDSRLGWSGCFGSKTGASLRFESEWFLICSPARPFTRGALDFNSFPACPWLESGQASAALRSGLRPAELTRDGFVHVDSAERKPCEVHLDLLPSRTTAAPGSCLERFPLGFHLKTPQSYARRKSVTQTGSPGLGTGTSLV